MDEEIKNYRSSLVTAIGIILGFVLGFAATWATQPVAQTDWSDYVIGLGLLISVVLQIIALYRILNNNFPRDKAGKYYQTTLRFFICGLCAAFAGVLISIFQTIFS
ncbi:MAG: hypothetical protein IPP48_14190 [Chitinophagaceae bacterium]|nr:hypothetical protein [Chitinophagaceae bacterium]